MLRFLALLLPLCVFTACNTPEPPSAARPQPVEPPPQPDKFSPSDVGEFRRAATHFRAVIGIPHLESTPDQVRHTLSNTMARAEAALAAIASCSHDNLTFANTFVALDDLGYDLALVANRLNLIKETSTNAALRE